MKAARIDTIHCDDAPSTAPLGTKAVASMETREKKIGPGTQRPNKVTDEGLLAKLATAVSAEDRDEVFDLAKTIVSGAARPPVEDDGLVPLPRVAQRLGISTRSVWRLVSAGELAAPVHVGGARRWQPEDVARYLSDIAASRRKAIRPRGR
jgi:predicted DNA-binding transcriptional regulator AlpA